jgi:hypothetical protein
MKIERFTGINNRQPIDRLKPDEGGGMPVRDAVNVDLSASGTFQTRQGSTSVVAAENARSAFTVDNTGSLIAVGDELMRFDGTSLTTLDALGSAFARVAYVKTPMGVVWSDGYVAKIVRNWTSGPLLPPWPNPLPTFTVSTGGSLRQGTYLLTFAAVFADGRRSSFTYPLLATVPENGRITVNVGTQPNAVQVFMTAPDGSIFYRQGQVSSGALNIALHNDGGEPIHYEVEDVIPPARILAQRNGRVYAATGGMLVYTQPWSMLHRPGVDYIPLPENIRLLAAVDAGVFVAADSKTWFLAGEPQEASFTEVAPYGAVEGTLAEVPNSTDLMWFTPRGQVRATQGGEFTLLQDKQIQFPKAAVGAATYRETNGMRQFIATLSDPVPTGSAVARSFMEFISS